MKSNLAYVNDQCEQALENDGVEVEVVGGFELERVSPPSPILVNSYREHAEEVTEKLRAIGVEPLAVLPARWWDKMVAGAGLIDIPLKAREIVLRPIQAHEESEKIKRAAVRTPFFLAGFITASSAFTCAYLGSRVSIDAAIAGFLAGGIIGAGGAFMVYVTLSRVIARLAGRIVARRLFRKGGDDIVRKMAAEPSDSFYGSGVPVEFRLPSPPPEFKDKLRRVWESDMKDAARVAAEPSAFTFDPSPATLLYNRAMEMREEEIEMRRRARADPIIYVKNGSAVAVVGQFGDFPIEKELVDRVTSGGLR